MSTLPTTLSPAHSLHSGRLDKHQCRTEWSRRRGDGQEGVLTASALPIPVLRMETCIFKGWTVAPGSCPSPRSVLPFSPKLLLTSPLLLATCFQLRAPALPSPTSLLCPHLHLPCPCLLRLGDRTWLREEETLGGLGEGTMQAPCLEHGGHGCLSEFAFWRL